MSRKICHGIAVSITLSIISIISLASAKADPSLDLSAYENSFKSIEPAQLPTETLTKNVTTQSTPISNAAFKLLEVVTTPDDVDQKVQQFAAQSDHEKLFQFDALVQRLTSYIDFDIAAFTEAKRDLDDRHDNAMKWNSIANILVSGMSGITPSALQYPVSKIPVATTNDISIAGSSAAAISSAIALVKSNAKAKVPESALLSAFLNLSDGKPCRKIYPEIVYVYLTKLQLHDLGYIGLEIRRIDAAKRKSDQVKANTETFAIKWLLDYWKQKFSNTTSSLSNDPCVIQNKKDYYKNLTSDDLSDRITMLTHLRILLETAHWSALELIAKYP